jgi:hypothetical protein
MYSEQLTLAMTIMIARCTGAFLTSLCAGLQWWALHRGNKSWGLVFAEEVVDFIVAFLHHKVIWVLCGSVYVHLYEQ